MEGVKEFTTAQVAAHCGRGGERLWVIYKDDVIDLTEFQYEHPGGLDIILAEAGQDATKAFDEVGHSGDAKRAMHKYKIGIIVESERKYRNGKRIVTAGGEDGRSCLSIITCGLLGG